MRGFAGAFISVAGLVYVMLMTNFMIALTCLPVWVLAILVDLRVSWLWVAATAILLSPALAGAYAVFKAYSLEGSTAAIRTYFRAWWGTWKRLWPVALGAVGLFFVVGVDFYATTLWGYGMLTLPLTVVLVCLGLGTALNAWVALVDRPDLTRWTVVKACLYLCVRKAGWTLLSLVVIGALASIIWVRPAVGLGILMAPGLYVVWGNCRRTLVSLLPAAERVKDGGAW